MTAEIVLDFVNSGDEDYLEDCRRSENSLWVCAKAMTGALSQGRGPAAPCEENPVKVIQDPSSGLQADIREPRVLGSNSDRMARCITQSRYGPARSPIQGQEPNSTLSLA